MQEVTNHSKEQRWFYEERDSGREIERERGRETERERESDRERRKVGFYSRKVVIILRGNKSSDRTFAATLASIWISARIRAG